MESLVVVLVGQIFARESLPPFVIITAAFPNDFCAIKSNTIQKWDAVFALP